MANFPGSLSNIPSSVASETLSAAGGIGHTALHNLIAGEIAAIQVKLGTGSSTPTSGLVLLGTGVGTSAWGQVSLTAGVTGVLPVANGGTGQSSGTGSGLPVFATSPTISGASLTGSPTLTAPTIADFTNAQHDHSTNARGGAISQIGLPTGVAVQQVSSLTSAVNSGATLIPFDNTIPQNTEGDEYMTLSITPKSVTNILIIQVIAVCSSSVANHLIAALFQDTTANALAADGFYQATNAGIATITLAHTMVAGTTSPTTFKVRLGQESAGTLTFNGRSSTQIFGAITKSLMIITEYKA